MNETIAKEKSAVSSAAALTKVLLICAAGLGVHVATGYRPFPSIDDFIYIPFSWAKIDPSLYSKDLFVGISELHLILWPQLVRLSEATVGLAGGFWLITVILTVLTVGGFAAILNASGLRLNALPLALMLLICAPQIYQGIGRGAYDGLFGRAFHAQWLGLSIVLFSYAEMIKGRSILAGLTLGAATLAHPMVAFHGAIVIGAATVATGAHRLKRLFSTGIACLIVSLPFLIPTLRYVSTTDAGSLPAGLLQELMRFRVPHEYDLTNLMNAGFLSLLGLEILLVLYSLRFLRNLPARDGIDRLIAIWVLHLLLLCASLLFHGTALGEKLGGYSLALFSLHLTRTTPLFFAISALIIASQFLATIADSQRGEAKIGKRIFWLSVLLLLLTFLHLADTVPAAITLAAVALAAFDPNIPRKNLLFATLCLLFLAISVKVDKRSATQGAEESELFAWIANTPKEAMFIIPPGFQEFRYYSKRSILVDFKCFTISASTMKEWWQRINLISEPDEETRTHKGWNGVAEWDKAYARSKTPEKVASLLKSTGANYLVFDRQTVPGANGGTGSEEVDVAFENTKYRVLTLANSPRD